MSYSNEKRGREIKKRIVNFPFKFLNSDFSFDNLSITNKSL